MYNLSDYITEYVSSGRGTYRMNDIVNTQLDELNKFMNDNPVALEALIAKIGRYYLFEMGYMPQPWIFYFNHSNVDDKEVDYYKIRMQNENHRWKHLGV